MAGGMCQPQARSVIHTANECMHTHCLANSGEVLQDVMGTGRDNGSLCSCVAVPDKLCCLLRPRNQQYTAIMHVCVTSTKGGKHSQKAPTLSCHRLRTPVGGHKCVVCCKYHLVEPYAWVGTCACPQTAAQ